MGQNTSSAVMQQRKEARDALDDFPTPPWATRALCEWLSQYHSLPDYSVREPCVNRGYMFEPLCEYFGSIDAADVHDYGAGFKVKDYLFGPEPDPVCFTIMNPPFRLATQFIERALATSEVGVCALVRTSFLEGAGRYDSLFSKAPPTTILQFTQRVVMHKGRVTEKGSTATSYCWLIWEKSLFIGEDTTARFEWIKPCRNELERPGDYQTRGDNVV